VGGAGSRLVEPRLVKVRAGRRGSGWALGAGGVITALHVVSPFLEGRVDQCLAVLDPARGAATFDCAVIWHDVGRDLALLAVQESQAAAWASMVGAGPGPALAEPGTGGLRAEVVGYPDAAMEDDFPHPELTLGWLKPARGAVSGEMVFDVEGSVPDDSLLWQGMSGAAIRDRPYGRLLGVVVRVDEDRQHGRLYAVAMPDPEDDVDFGSALRQVGVPAVLEVADAPRHRRLLAVLDEAGRPYAVGEIPDMGRLGPRRSRTDIDTRGDPYYPYVTREVDRQLAGAMDDRVHGRDRRVLLIVGRAMTGKSRTAARAVMTHPAISQMRLLRPHVHSDWAEVVELATSFALAGGAVLWLDDAQTHLSRLDGEQVRSLTNIAGLVAVGTIRTEAMADLLARPDLISAGRVLNDDALIQRIELAQEWTAGDQTALADADPVIRERVASGQPLGQALGAADELRARLGAATDDQRALVHLAADWPGTGVAGSLPEHSARRLWLAYLPHVRAAAIADAVAEDVEAAYVSARDWATQAVAGTAALVTRTRHGLASDDSIAADRTTTRRTGSESESISAVGRIPAPVWEAALDQARKREARDTNSVGLAALIAGERTVAREAWEPAAEAGNVNAMQLLGLLLQTMDPPDLDAARRWYTLAAEAGHAGAMAALAWMAEELDPPDIDGARRWYTAAAEAGGILEMNNLAIWLASPEHPDLDGAQHWWRRAAEAGDSTAMYNLALLLQVKLDPPDVDSARVWWRRAAEAGDVTSMKLVGQQLVALDPPDLDGAREWWRRAAEAGDAEAMYNLGVLMQNQDPPDLDDSRRWYTKAAEAGETQAMTALGLLLAGRDPPDLDGARRWLMAAAEAGSTAAMSRLGLLFAQLDPPDAEGAEHWWQRAAEAGDIEAMHNLGAFLEGLDPPDLDGADRWFSAFAAADAAALCDIAAQVEALDPSNLDRARRRYAAAAEAGSTAAMSRLGLLLTQLDPPDTEGAQRWWSRAAEAGESDAMYNLGVLHESLDPPDLNGARQWYGRAAEAGHLDGMKAVGQLLAALDPPDLDGARGWWRLAAEAGDSTAMFNLGILLTELDPPDTEGTQHWWSRAAEAGESDAMFNLGVLHESLDPPDPNGARQWYGRAAEAGHLDGMKAVGQLLEELDPPDLVGARRWYTAAAEAGDPEAMFDLAQLLEEWDPPRLDEARRWYAAAGEAGNADAMYSLGLLFARLEYPDVDQALRCWHRAATAGQVDAAIAMACLWVLEGELEHSLELLTQASTNGHMWARRFAAGLKVKDAVGQHEVMAELRVAELAGDTDALNAQGVLAWAGGRFDDANDCWQRASMADDPLAPILRVRARPRA
jgi:TPR repeat protein